MMTSAETVLEALREAARAEKAQAAFYRRLAAATQSPALCERFNELLADEQHHLSRLVARLLELGVHEGVDPQPEAPDGALDWEEAARERERGEIGRYERLLGLELDSRTRAMIESFLEVERRHAAELRGKWMGA